MVADPGPDVLIPALTWAYVIAALTVHGSWGSMSSPGGRRKHRSARRAWLGG